MRLARYLSIWSRRVRRVARESWLR